MGLIESQGTLLCIGFAIAVGAFIIQFLLCITKVHLYIKLIPLYLLGMYALFILLVLTGLIWDDTNFYISAIQIKVHRLFLPNTAIHLLQESTYHCPYFYQ